jgi:hypothetical protein
MKIQSLAQWWPRRGHLHSAALGEGSTSVFTKRSSYFGASAVPPGVKALT